MRSPTVYGKKICSAERACARARMVAPTYFRTLAPIIGTVHYLYPRGGGKMGGGHVKFILSYGGYLLFLGGGV